MIIYIHGFASSANSKKAKLLKENFEYEILMPSLSYIPTLAISSLSELIEFLLYKKEKVFLIGASLGGYYAMYLANKYNLKAVLINPSIYPYKTLNKIGLCTNYFDMSNFEVTKEHIEILKLYQVKNIKNAKNFLVLLQKEDEVLDYKEAEVFLKNSKLIVEEGGTHSFENLDKHYETIKNFLI